MFILPIPILWLYVFSRFSFKRQKLFMESEYAIKIQFKIEFIYWTIRLTILNSLKSVLKFSFYVVLIYSPWLQNKRSWRTIQNFVIFRSFVSGDSYCSNISNINIMWSFKWFVECSLVIVSNWHLLYSVRQQQRSLRWPLAVSEQLSSFNYKATNQ